MNFESYEKNNANKCEEDEKIDILDDILNSYDLLNSRIINVYQKKTILCWCSNI